MHFCHFNLCLLYIRLNSKLCPSSSDKWMLFFYLFLIFLRQGVAFIAQASLKLMITCLSLPGPRITGCFMPSWFALSLPSVYLETVNIIIFIQNIFNICPLLLYRSSFYPFSRARQEQLHSSPHPSPLFPLSRIFIHFLKPENYIIKQFISIWTHQFSFRMVSLWAQLLFYLPVITHLMLKLCTCWCLELVYAVVQLYL